MAISHATDISGREIEMLSVQEMKSQQIIPVAKELFVDIIAVVPSYSHDKPEGIALISSSVLCVVNDDDFGINAAADDKYIPKLNAKGALDKNMIYFISISQE